MILQNFIVTGDTHARHEPYEDDLSVARRLLLDLGELAKEHNASTIILNGDVWHLKNGVHPPVLLMLYETLQLLRAQGHQVIWIRGNHESPWRAQPHKTLMHLFSEVCTLVIEPRKIETSSYVIWCLPWYPGKTFKKLLKEVVQEALVEERQKIIIAHIGVREGAVSASNYRIEQEVSVKDFCPELFDYVILGDYHMHQHLADNVLYLGAPIPHTFGDSGIEGPWLLHLGHSPILTPIQLPSVYPQYDKWVVEHEDEIILNGYNQNNRNRIYCPHTLSYRLDSMYPDADVQPIEEDNVTHSSGRLEGISDEDYTTLFNEFSIIKEYDERHKELGLYYLEEAHG